MKAFFIIPSINHQYSILGHMKSGSFEASLIQRAKCTICESFQQMHDQNVCVCVNNAIRKMLE
jgi:hypothetical protein